MKILAIADPYIPADLLTEGTSALVEAGHDVDVVSWSEASTIQQLQEVNLRIEQHGPNALELPSDVQDKIREADIVLTQFAPLGTKLIESTTHLRIIGVLRGGIENVDKETAERLGIRVINTPGRNARAVAEFAVGMILAETRNIARTHAAMRRHIWLKDFPNSDDIPELEGKTIGIVGAGNIGQLVMKFLSSFDVECIYYDPYTDECPYGRKIDDLDELMRISDVVSIHSRLTSSTHHLIDERRIALMKPTAVVVNTARSGLVDEKALLSALSDNKIMGAAIDTFDDEPLPANSPWMNLDNVTITSHLAGSTKDAFRKTPHMLSRRILDALAEETVR
ncbi:2-hydroxyacid dehydrogenase [Arcanobacterium haemolyticum]|nr:2-hydroxyacid dehydrogenase [Arcanobacterium haemolyticum]